MAMKWFRDFPIWVKIMSFMVAVLGLTAVMGMLTIQRLSALHESARDMSGNWMPSIQHSSALLSAVSQYRIQEVRHVLATNGEDKAHIEESKASWLARVDREAEQFLRSTPSDRAAADY